MKGIQGALSTKSNLWTRRLMGMVLLPALFLLACASGNDLKEAPVWVSEYPADDAYYIGLGSSNSGNLAEDRGKAAVAARSEIAAQISVQVSSNLQVQTLASTGSKTQEKYKRQINEVVNQNLKSVEIVDYWISSKQGVWVYARLSKAKWASIVLQESLDLSERVNGILGPVASGGQSIATDMVALANSINALEESPWGNSVRDKSFGSGEFLMEKLDKEINARLSFLSFDAGLSASRVKFGLPARISGRVSGTRGQEIGSLAVEVVLPDGGSQVVNTDTSGSFSLLFAPDVNSSGPVSLEITPALQHWGLDRGRYSYPVKRLEMVIEPVVLNLSIDHADSPVVSSMDSYIQNWLFSLDFPVSLKSGGGVADFDVDFVWQLMDYARLNESSPFIVDVGAEIRLSRSGKPLYSQAIPSIKDGGSSLEQAHRNGAGVLMKRVQDSKKLAEEIEQAIQSWFGPQ